MSAGKVDGFFPEKLEVIDSHTGGEPTRMVVSGWPQPLGEDMESRLRFMRENQDSLRRAAICEPRGHDAIVGALLTPAVNAGSVAGVIFFNDVGYLGMCGHGMIGTVATLKFMGKISEGSLRVDTPVGTVAATLDAEGYVSIENIASFLYQEKVAVDVPGVGKVVGDIAYSGNWFFMVESTPIEPRMENLDALMAYTKKIRIALEVSAITGPLGERIDHIEVYGQPLHAQAHSKNFVLCPGSAYDRSPCGTGTSAKMASLYKKGKLALGEKWIQESITGSIFEGHLLQRGQDLIPVIRSTAHVVASSTLYFSPSDPFRMGISNAV